MRLLKITDQKYEELDRFFDESERVNLDEVAPEVVGGEKNVRVGEKSIEDFDAVYAEIPAKNSVFGRVMLEMVEEKNVSVNTPSLALFIMSKKNYLYYVLHEKELPAPKTISIASEKAARNIEKELEPPVIGRKLEELEETETKKLETEQEIQGFAEGTEYEEDVLLFHEYQDGAKYRCLITQDRIIPLEDDSEGWKFDRKNLKYSNLSDDQKEVVEKTIRAIGTPVAEVVLRGKQVYDVNPDPDLEMYTDIGGKDAYEAVANVLKGDE